jgi:TRAP-type C4-dicarboxylate transport system permease large subunit
VNVYVVKSVAEDVPLMTIFRGILPFVVTLTVALVILLFFPIIATILPSFLTY